MNTKILDLSNLKANDILKVIYKSEQKTCFCIVESCTQISKEDLISRFTYERQQKTLEENDYNFSSLIMVEFNKDTSPWSMTLPTKTASSFLSISDNDYDLNLFTSSLEEVKFNLLTEQNTAIEFIFNKTIGEVVAVKESYSKIIGNTMQKLVEK